MRLKVKRNGKANICPHTPEWITSHPPRFGDSRTEYWGGFSFHLLRVYNPASTWPAWSKGIRKSPYKTGRVIGPENVIHFTLRTIRKGRSYFYPHLTDEETEGPERLISCLMSYNRFPRSYSLLCHFATRLFLEGPASSWSQRHPRGGGAKQLGDGKAGKQRVWLLFEWLD